MRSAAIAVFLVCMASAAQASSLVYFKDEKPSATPSVQVIGTQQAVRSSVLSVGEAQQPITNETTSAIPGDRGQEGVTMVIRDGVVGSALPRQAVKPALATGVGTARQIPANASAKLPASGKLKPEALR